MNVPNRFGDFFISRNNDEFRRRYSVLKDFPHPQVYVHPHEIYIYYILISTK